MKILVLNGSPKSSRSNTLRLTNAFLEGAGWSASSDTEPTTDTIDLAKATIKPCTGCFACWNKTPGECVIHDDMTQILQKMLQADVIIWSFPLYFFSTPGGLKNLIDRQLPLSLPFMDRDTENGGHPPRYDLTQQKHIVISTCGFWTTEGNYSAVRSMFDHMCGQDRYTLIACAQGDLFAIPELHARTDAYLDLVRQAGEEYATGGIGGMGIAAKISDETSAQLARPLYPRATYETMADASWGVAKAAPTHPSTSAASNAEITAGHAVVEDGKPVDDSFVFTKQMAALYVPDDKERVLEFHYTDIDKTYQILMTPQGSEVITENFRPFTTQIKTPYEVWRRIARNEISGKDAMYEHLYTVEGDFDLMLNWDNLFGAGTPSSSGTSSSAGKGAGRATGKQASGGREQRKANMMIMLLPWIAFWVTIGMDPRLCGIVSIAAASLMPLGWLKYRMVIYEQISIPLVTGLGLAALFGADTRMLAALSYLLFGLMWVAGALAKVPLSAHYSAANYGGDSAFSNRLFLRTNRILTAIWGGLYILTPIWTYALMGTPLAPYTGLINSVLPALMGFFTAWFQEWYPPYYARQPHRVSLLSRQSGQSKRSAKSGESGGVSSQSGAN